MDGENEQRAPVGSGTELESGGEIRLSGVIRRDRPEGVAECGWTIADAVSGANRLKHKNYVKASNDRILN